jgi:RNA polymerase sigma factor (sigma-70 family)
VPSPSRAHEDLWRRAAPQVLGAVVRRYGDFDACEDAVQEALLAAATQWSTEGVPDDPRAWLIRVASRRLIDQRRSDTARTRREERVAGLEPDDPGAVAAGDDTVALLAMCCHDALTPSSQVALTLRAVAGLTTAEIARAFLVPEATMAQRISRAKQRIRDGGARFEPPTPGDPTGRMDAVLHVLYLVFNEGHTTTGGPDLLRPDLTAEAIRLTRVVREQRPTDGETAGLLALMLLTEARRSARTRPDSRLVPLSEQDRSQWDPAYVAEGVALVSTALSTAPIGPYQVEAAIAAVHAEAARTEETDWVQILALYDLLTHWRPDPVVALNRAVAVAEVHGPEAALRIVDELGADAALARGHRLHAVRAHLLERLGEVEDARASYRLAARLTTSLPEQRYLTERSDRL